MKIKTHIKTLLLEFLILCIVLMTSSLVFSKDTDTPSTQLKTPEWLKRIDFAADGGTEQNLRIFFETVQPIYQDMDETNTWFVQPRFSLENQQGAFNMGFGYRRLLFDDTVLVGANSFFDFEAEHAHYRVGVGAEAFINLIELRTNAYIGLSPRRLVEEVGATRTYEKAVDGFDVEAGLPLPYVNWVSLYGSGYFYNYEKFKNKEGWRIRTQVKPFKYTTVNLIAWDDNKGDPEFRVEARVTIPFEILFGEENSDPWCNIGIAKEPYAEKITHNDKVLNRVEREYKIEVERWKETPGTSGNVIVEIRRGG